MKTLNDIKKDVLADGVIDVFDVRQIEEFLFKDGVIDAEKADFLFELNSVVSGKANDPSWKELFVKYISSYILDDPKSFNVVDNEETKWLFSKIKEDGKIDEVERALLVNLSKKAKIFPVKLMRLLYTT